MSARCCPPASGRCACCCARWLARVATIPPPRACACTSSAPATSRSPPCIACCPIARECGVADVVTEMPGRLDYLDALSVLTQASGILLLGSSERHYTASKLYPALLAQRPILALFHEASSVVSILRAAGAEPSVRVVTYGDGEPRRRSRSGRRLVTCARIAAGRHLQRRGRVARSHRRRVGAPSRAPSWRRSSIGWRHDDAGPADRGADAPDSVLRAMVPPHPRQRAGGRADGRARDAADTASSRASASITHSSGTCR